MITTPTVTRGHLTVPSRGLTQQFMFNPEEVTDEKQVNWGILSIPGASHPTYQFGSGGERLISFTLYLDGDRGRFDRNIGEVRNLGITRGLQDSELSVRRIITFYQSLVFPADIQATDMAAAYPYLCLFTLGTLWDGVPVIVKRAAVRVSFWTPDMQPVRATIDLQFGEVPYEGVSATTIYPDFDFG